MFSIGFPKNPKRTTVYMSCENGFRNALFLKKKLSKHCWGSKTSIYDKAKMKTVPQKKFRKPKNEISLI